MLKEYGHRGVFSYSIGRLLDETVIVTERKNADMASAAVLFQMAIHTFPVEASKGAIKQANERVRDFNTAIRKMIGER